MKTTSKKQLFKAIPVLVNRNRNSSSVPVCGRIIRFRSYPRQDSGTLNITRQNRSCRLSHLSSSSILLPNQVPTPGSRNGTSARYNNSHSTHSLHFELFYDGLHLKICSLNPISHGIFFLFGSQGGVGINPPLWKIHFGVSEPNSIFKTLEMRSAQSSAANLTNALKIRKSKI